MPRQTDRFVLPSVLPPPIPPHAGRGHQRRRPDRADAETATHAIKGALGTARPKRHAPNTNGCVQSREDLTGPTTIAGSAACDGRPNVVSTVVRKIST